MSRLRSAVTAVAVVAGLLAGVLAFQGMSEGAVVPDPEVVASSIAARSTAPRVTVPRILPGTRFVWAPCEPPARLRHDRCVTRVVRTVTLPGG